MGIRWANGGSGGGTPVSDMIGGLSRDGVTLRKSFDKCVLTGAVAVPCPTEVGTPGVDVELGGNVPYVTKSAWRVFGVGVLSR